MRKRNSTLNESTPNCPGLKLSGGVPIHVWKPGKNFGPKSQCKIFHGRPILGGYQSPTDFLEIEQNSEKYFFEDENVKNKI